MSNSIAYEEWEKELRKMQKRGKRNYVTLTEIAAKIGVTRDCVRKALPKAGIKPIKVVAPSSHHQPTLALTQNDAAKFIKWRYRHGYYETT